MFSAGTTVLTALPSLASQNPSCVHFFFFARPTDPPSREGGRWETKHFMGMASLIYGIAKPQEGASEAGVIFRTYVSSTAERERDSPRLRTGPGVWLVEKQRERDQ